MSSPPSRAAVFRLALVFALLSICGGIAWMFSGQTRVVPVNVKFVGPTEVCFHNLVGAGVRPKWGAIAPNVTGIGSNPACLLNVEIPSNWDCWLGNTEPSILSRLFPKWFPPNIHRYTIANGWGEVLAHVPQPICHRLQADGSYGPDWPMPLDVVIPTTPTSKGPIPLPPVMVP